MWVWCWQSENQNRCESDIRTNDHTILSSLKSCAVDNWEIYLYPHITCMCSLWYEHFYIDHTIYQQHLMLYHSVIPCNTIMPPHTPHYTSTKYKIICYSTQYSYGTFFNNIACHTISQWHTIQYYNDIPHNITMPLYNIMTYHNSISHNILTTFFSIS